MPPNTTSQTVSAPEQKLNLDGKTFIIKSPTFDFRTIQVKLQPTQVREAKDRLSDKPGVSVSVSWIESIKTLLDSAEYNLSAEVQKLFLSAADRVGRELNITQLDSSEIRQVVDSIKRVVDEVNKSQAAPKNSNSFLLPKHEYSLKETIELDVWHSLNFFAYRNELLKDALTTSQVSRILCISIENILKQVEQQQMLAVERNGEYLFPIEQFDNRNPSGIVDKLPNVLNALEISDIAKLSWLTNPNPVLEGKRPFEILKSASSEEDKQRVISEAYGVGRC